jgi:hypothetical protein
MTLPTSRASVLGGALLAAMLATQAASAQQTPSMPSTLRYGSGLLDIPVSSVLPHLEITGTYSGFFVGIDRDIEVDAAGVPTGFGPGVHDFYSDASLAIGLLDRFETGLSLQSFGGDSDGGNVWGLFGRVRLWEPIDQGIGLAAGARYLTSPDFGDGREYFPARLGFADDRFGKALTGGTNFSFYGVATAYLRGFDGGPLPENDMTFTLGYGGGMFREGGRLDFYGPGHSNGWFYGTSVHLDVGEERVLSLMAEHDGFDINIGAQFDWEGLRVGAHYLASNHAAPNGGYASAYQAPKFGFLASVAVCPTLRGLRCKPNLMRRTEPDTIFIPAPPPDTVVVNLASAPPPPEGEAVTLCLSTGRNAPVLVTAQGDTLVGPSAVPISSLRPTVDFVGGYAGDAFWFVNGDRLAFEGENFGKAEDVFPIDCDQILRVGVYQGVPVFADRAAERPLVMLFIPVRPGLWQRYERGLE